MFVFLTYYSQNSNFLIDILFLKISGEPVNGIENRLDHCKVTVSPSLNPDHESVEVPGDLLRSLSIIGKVKIVFLLVFLLI